MLDSGENYSLTFVSVFIAYHGDQVISCPLDFQILSCLLLFFFFMMYM